MSQTEKNDSMLFFYLLLGALGIGFFAIVVYLYLSY
jgi:hypothetical protein